MHTFTFFSILIYLIANAQLAVAEDTQLQQRWGTTVSEPEAKQAHHFNPLRIMNRTYDSFIHFSAAMIDLADFKKKDHFSQATFQFAESFLDPFDLTNDILSDLGAAIKSPQYIGHRMSSRIQVCTGNLGLIDDDIAQRKYPDHALFQDVYHVGILLDGQEKFTDTGGGGLKQILDKGGADCSYVPILSNEPEEVAMSRLYYTANFYAPEYHFASSDCGYFTRDVLNASGLAYPIFPNVGIGNEIPLTTKYAEFKQQRQLNLETLQAAKARGDMFIANLRKLFDELEKGQVPDIVFEANVFYFKATPDAIFQAIISATRGGNPDAQIWVIDNMFGALKLDELLKFGKTKVGKELYTQMMSGVRVEDLLWFSKFQPLFQTQMAKTLNEILQ